MPDFIPASTKVRTSRIRNIDTDRLQRRAAWLAANKHLIARDIDSRDNPTGRNRMRDVAREILTIDAELSARANANTNTN